MGQRVHDALEAIVYNNATEEAYEVARKAGWGELFPGCIYQIDKGAKMEVKTARAIITQARKDETYAGPMPEDDETCVKEAETLVDMANQAWDQYIRGPEVEAIRNLAANGGEPESPPEPESEKTETEPEPEEEGKAPEPSSEEEDETAPPQDLADVDPQLLKIEPWEGYNEDRVKDITQGINVGLESEDDPAELLGHIWAYESAHKRRVRILKHVKEAWERVGGRETEEEDDSQDGSPEAEPGADVSDGSEPAEPSGEEAEQAEAPEAPPEEHRQGHESVPQAPEGEAEPSDAPDDSGGKTAPEGAEDRRTEHEGEPPPQDRAYAALVGIVDRQLQSERLDIPKPPSEDPPVLPWRWADISDSDLHDFHMQFASMAYYKSYVLSREERLAMHCKEAAEELTSKLLVRADKYDEKGKQKTVTLLEAEISLDENVKKWRHLQHKHEQFTQNAKREMESYLKLVEALSRLESMRHQMWERSRR